MEKYLIYPDVRDNLIAFVSDNDLWTYNIDDKNVERLTNNLGIITNPRISPDKKYVYFRLMTGKSGDSSDIYSIDIENGNLNRITYLCGKSTSRRMYTSIAGFDKNNNLIISTDAYYPFGTPMLFRIINKNLEPLNLGPALTIIYYKNNIILGRNTIDMPHWKKYKGGTRGKILSAKNNDFKIVVDLESNVNSPMICNDNLYFISDHEGTANIYSTDLNGNNITKHTDFTDYYVRNANSDNNRIIFQKGGSLFILENDKVTKLEIDINVPSVNTENRILKATDYLTDYKINYSGNLIGLITRGQAIFTGIKNGPAMNINKLKNQIIEFMNNNNVVVYNYNEDNNNILIYNIDKTLRNSFEFRNGIIFSLKVSPDNNYIAIGNNRYELFILNIKDGGINKIDESKSGVINDFSWSNDSMLLAYSYPETEYYGYNGSSSIKLYDLKSNKKYDATTSGSVDFNPVFSIDGNYLFYLSKRSLDPVSDQLAFNFAYPKITKPYAIPLKENVLPLFSDVPEEFNVNTLGNYNLKNILKLSEVFPVSAEDYVNITPVNNGVLLFYFPVEGSMKYYLFNNGEKAGNVNLFDFKNKKSELYENDVVNYAVSGNKQFLLIRKSGNKFIKKEIESKKDDTVDIDRLSITVEPLNEWKNMLYDTFNLIKENFWSKEKLEKLGDEPYFKYKRLLDKISSRFELSDLMREMQGEYSTSHSYEIGGDLTNIDSVGIGKLGIDYTFENGKYVITKIYNGDLSDENEKSPLLYTDIKENDVIKSINGVTLDEDNNPDRVLLNHAKEIITLEVEKGNELKKYYVKTMIDEKYLRYRNFVETNRKYVHDKTNDKIGYIHIPDMGMNGLNEFFRIFDREANRDGLIVDLRFNGGGFVSQLLLEKLSRKRLGYDVPRRGIILPYPIDSVNGPMIALTNEYAGSDGDIGTHVFKLMKLGKVIGTRTWGGVIGINPKIKLIDDTTVTQPQFATWFKDVKYGLENYGSEPDIYVENMPQNFLKSQDLQLDTAIEMILNDAKNYKKLELS
ncbi:S41 family peptidase [Ferroplasma acidarmanus]|uniref:Tricorn protease n=1 Tax=Ferroplasma acidarmanus Fer1 TaxID=333146 RepID=S0AS93_FERAC|nr:S41 family peptidase [Ferroplasma acidarmanus]AGO61667.1 tricorn protease [Ferroplasma acidarmanus Fer1]